MSAVVLVWCATLLAIVDQWRAAAVVGAVLLSGVAVLMVDQHKTNRLVLRTTSRANLPRIESDLHRLRAGTAEIGDGIRELRLALQDHQIATRNELMARVDLVAVELRSMSEGLVATGAALAGENRALRQETGERLRDVARRLDVARQRQDVVAENQISEIDALLQILRRVPLEGAAPLLGSWAITPRGMLQLIDLIERFRPGLIVECGPGTSTVYAAATLRALGLNTSRIVGLEHQLEFAEQTRNALSQHGLVDLVEIRHAALTEWQLDGETYSWYEPAALEDINEIDLLLIDGPPGTTGRRARYPAFPALKTRLRDQAHVLLDDAKRDDERRIVEEWSAGGELRRVPSLSGDQAVLIYSPPPAVT